MHMYFQILSTNHRPSDRVRRCRGTAQFDQTRKIQHNSEKSAQFWSITISDVFSVSLNTNFPVHNQDFQNP